MEKIRKNIKPIFLLCMGAVVAVVWYAVFYFESHQNLVITFFDVGQGDSVFISAPGGNQVLIDGGSNDAVLAKLGRAMPFWDHSIDLIILTHPHADHVSGLVDVLLRYTAGMILETGVNYSTPEYAEWRRIIKEKDIKVITAHRGQSVYISDGARLDILAPFEDFTGKSVKNVHDAMIVPKLKLASTSVLLMGDAEKRLEYQLLFLRSDLAADVLKVGHHGSKTSTTDEFLRAVSPKTAVISAGRKNRYGHPNQEVLDRLGSAGVRVLRTDQEGDIVIREDGGWDAETGSGRGGF